eukprot:2710601-Pyramimonas_sp.AAC.1
MQTVFELAVDAMGSTRRPWLTATSPAHALLLSLADIGWQPVSARIFRKADGEEIDLLLQLAPLAVREFAARDAVHRADVKALNQRPSLNTVWVRPGFWEGARKMINGTRNVVWHDHHQACARNCFAMGTWTQQR